MARPTPRWGSMKARDATHCDQVSQNESRQTTWRSVHAAEPFELGEKRDRGATSTNKAPKISERHVLSCLPRKGHPTVKNDTIKRFVSLSHDPTFSVPVL